MKRKRDHIFQAMAKHNLVFALVGAMVIFGIWSLPKLNKDEFPQFTIRQGVIVAIYPGATAKEVEEQVTKPLEDFLFSYEEINKTNTYSQTEDGVVYIFAELDNQVERKDETWAKIRAGLDLCKKTSLPAGVLQIAVIDDFGNTASILLAIESEQHTPRELQAYAKTICAGLRKVNHIGKIKVLGEQQEEIAVTVDVPRLAAYGIDSKMLMLTLATEGFRSIGGTAGQEAGNITMHVHIPYRTEYELSQQIIFADAATGQTLRMKDVADIERRYVEGKSVHYYANGDQASCLIISIEMMPGHNIVQFGKDIDTGLQKLTAQLPADIQIHRISDQPKVVDKSVVSFLGDILTSMIVVVLVMLMLFPLKTALVACLGVPVCITISFGVMYLTGIQLHTVTLGALITVLGLIVDDAVIIVDGYSNKLEQGHSRWYAANVSTRELFSPTLIATISIAGMFYPMTHIITGPLGEFVQLFPITITIALLASFGFAVWVTPYLATRFIRRQKENEMNRFERLQNRFFGFLQNTYKRLLSFVFRHSRGALLFTLMLLVLSGWLFSRLNIQMMPKAERASFAVEIHLREGCTIQQTAYVADSLARALEADRRVKSITSFVGQASPRFHAAYAPQMAKPSYAQFIVNTASDKATVDLLREYTPIYENAFPNAYVRFKQMDYQCVKNPVEVYVEGDDYPTMAFWADSIKQYLATIPNVLWVHSDYDDTKPQMRIDLKQDEATRLGVTQAMLSFYLNAYFSGQPLTTIWEDDYSVPVNLYSAAADQLDYSEVQDLLVPTAYPGVWVPLHQVAELTPAYEHAILGHRNGIRTITVGADLAGTTPQPPVQRQLQEWIETHIPSEAPIHIRYGGLTSVNKDLMPEIILSFVGALLVMLLVLLYHFGRLGISLMTLSSSILCLFGSMVGLSLFGLDFSITAVLGIVSLIGIIVRNTIIMYEYADQLRLSGKYTAREAAFEAGLRRMRPVFLTSITTALGVVPMIISHTALWMPMGVVICFGTIFTLPLIVTILPVAYWKIIDSTHTPTPRMKKTLILLCLLSVPALSAMADNEALSSNPPLTLDSCLALARKNNHAIRQQQYAVAEAEEQKYQAITKYFPQVQGVAIGYASLDPYISVGTEDISDPEMRNLLNKLFDTYGAELGLRNPYTLLQNGYSVGLAAMQPIFMGGKVVAGNRLASLGIKAAKLQQEIITRDKLLEIEQTFWLCIGLEEKKQTVEAAQALLDTLHRVVSAAADAGLTLSSDLLKVELKQREIAAQSLQLHNGVRLSKRALCQAIGIPYSDALQLRADISLLSDSVFTLLLEQPQALSLDSAGEETVSRRPESQLLALQVRAEELQRMMTIADALPHILLGGGYAYSQILNKPAPNGTAFLSLTLPLTAWWETGHKIKQHNLKIRAAEEQQADLNEQMLLQTYQAYDQMQEAYALTCQHLQSLSTARENYRLSLLAYEEGMITIAELLESQTTLLQTSNALTDAHLSLLLSTHRLQSLLK